MQQKIYLYLTRTSRHVCNRSFIYIYQGHQGMYVTEVLYIFNKDIKACM